MELFGKEKYSLSKKIKSSVKKAVSHVSNFEDTAIELAIEQKYDYVVCGHIHQPQMRVVNKESGTTTYLNSGDWIENLTALEYHKGNWELYFHKDVKIDKRSDSEEVMQLNLNELIKEVTTSDKK